MKIRANKNLISILSFLSFLALILVLFSNLGIIVKILVFLNLSLFIFSLFNFRLGFLFFIFLRPFLDLQADLHGLNIFNLELNILSLYGFSLCLLALIFFLENRKELLEHKKYLIFWTWLVFLALAILSFLNTISIFSSLRELLRYFSFFASFLLGLSLFKDAKNLTKLIKLIIISALAPSVLALIQLLNRSGLLEEGIYRVFGSFTHPNMLAFYLILSISLSVFLILNLNRKKLSTYLYLTLALFYTLILFFTYARGAYLALAIVFLLIGLIRFRKFLFLSLLAIILLISSVPSIQARVLSLSRPDLYGSIAWRLNLWEDSFSYFKESPIIGHGIGTAEELIALKRDFRLGSSDPHNDYLRIALDGGSLLLLSYLGLIFSLFLSNLQAFQNEVRPRLKYFFLFFLSFLLAIFTMSVGDNILNDTALMWQAWAIAGASLSVHLNYQQKNLKNSNKV